MGKNAIYTNDVTSALILSCGACKGDVYDEIQNSPWLRGPWRVTFLKGSRWDPGLIRPMNSVEADILSSFDLTLILMTTETNKRAFGSRDNHAVEFALNKVTVEHEDYVWFFL